VDCYDFKPSEPSVAMDLNSNIHPCLRCAKHKGTPRNDLSFQTFSLQWNAIRDQDILMMSYLAE
jgi:hypothetical protein